MRVLVFEYVTGGGMWTEPIPSTLAREGSLMVEALLRDLAALPEIRPIALRDPRFPVPEKLAHTVDWVVLEPDAGWKPTFLKALERCDAAWPIAPETGGILEDLCLAVETAQRILLNSPAAAVRLTASKLNAARRLAVHGVPVVSTRVCGAEPPRGFPAVVKPDDGVGCEGIRIVETAADWLDSRHRTVADNSVLQPLVAGDALSLSALFCEGRARLLSVNRLQVRRENGGFVLTACETGAIRDDGTAPFRDLLRQVAAALPELWGYAGIDLIDTGDKLLVLEVNPRLTTSYAGLSESSGINPAKWVLELWRSGTLPEVELRAARPVEVRLDWREEP